MALYLVSARGEPGTQVDSPNWLSALGIGLEQLGVVTDIDRLACEVLPNGTVIARDVRTGAGYVVKRADRFDEADGDSAGTSPAGPGPMGALANGGGVDDEDELIVTGPDEDYEDAFDDPSDGDLLDLPSDQGFTSDFDELLDDESVEDEDSYHEAVHRLDALVAGTGPALDDDSVLISQAAVRRAPSAALAWQEALRVCVDLVPCDASAAIVGEPDGGLRFVAATGTHAHKLIGVRLPQHVGLAGFSIDRRVSLVVRDPERDPRFYRELEQAVGYTTRAMMSVAVALEGRVFGCVQLLNPPELRPFTRAHIELVEMIAAELADRLVALGE